MADLERAFLHDILENPDDDAPRLILADWLDERGDAARAEFIRVQVELARLDRCEPRWPGLKRREGQLLAAHSLRWIQDAGVDGLDEPRFRRGFVEHAAFGDPLEYLAQAGRLLQRVPLSSATFGSLGDWDDEMAARPGVGRLFRSRLVRPLRRLEFHTIDQLRGEDLAQLARFPSGACLEELDLGDNDLGDNDLQVLARCPALARLRVLGLADNNFGPAGVAHLAQSRHLVGLRELDLASVNYGRFRADAVEALVSSPYLTALTALNLSGHRIGGQGMSLLARWPGLAGLRRLNLAYNYSAEAAQAHRQQAGLRELVESPHWGSLRELDLSGGTVDDLATLEMLLAAANVASLRILRLGQFSQFRRDGQDEAAQRVARAASLAGLIELHFAGRLLSEPARRLLRDRFGERLVLVE